MFFHFLSLSHATFASVDMGAEFLRVATVELTGNPTISSNREGTTLTPNAVAFKTKTKPTGRLNESMLDGIQIKYGKNAVKYLKNNPKSGANYIGRIMGRTATDDFDTPKIASASELFALQLKELFTAKDLIGIEGATISVPAYYTYRTREAIIKSVYAAHVPFLGIIDDYTGIMTMYARNYHERYTGKNHSVLFVDVGASHAATYRVDFYENSTHIVANQTSYEWSEETGSLAFAKVIAEEKGISLHKAMKLVKEGKFDPELVSQEVEELQRIILLAMGNDEVDCVQLFGGASRFQFIEEAIEQSVEIKPSRELPIGEATVIAGALMTQLIANKIEWPVTIVRSPIYSSSVRCNNVSATYCQKGNKCTDMVVVDNCLCDHLYIEADKTEIPAGAGSLLSDYILTNISDWHSDEEIVSGIIMLEEPLPIITHVNWCVTSTLDCKPITGKQYEVPLKSYQQSVDFVSSVKSAEVKVKRVATLRGQIRGLVDQLQFSVKKGDEELINSITENALKIADQSNDLDELDDVIRQLKEHVNNEL